MTQWTRRAWRTPSATGHTTSPPGVAGGCTGGSTGTSPRPATRFSAPQPWPWEGPPFWAASPTWPPRWIWRLSPHSLPSRWTRPCRRTHPHLTPQKHLTNRARRNTPKRRGLGKSQLPHSLYSLSSPGRRVGFRLSFELVKDTSCEWQAVKVTLYRGRGSF